MTSISQVDFFTQRLEVCLADSMLSTVEEMLDTAEHGTVYVLSRHQPGSEKAPGGPFTEIEIQRGRWRDILWVPTEVLEDALGLLEGWLEVYGLDIHVIPPRSAYAA